ncbi:hypothetical protein JQN72_06005 [Phycicoccus sp. CSK15P-2]|uniref:hypothetical protein n=1 Tax=Phycicoccus sp. CSK15P-2 TaxID=2807627 RepID=UPI001951D6EE|nr:hypothetical protein [Phycicoccus sp. CSK15P-2]MBM6403794.1 hypothetical protein [Phycicoccus sp. CSK15P-2]
MTSPAPPSAEHSRHGAGAAGAVVAMVSAFWVLRGTWGSGQYLVRDFVAVPDPALPRGLLPDTASALRAWPLDGVTWALALVIPTGVQQAVMLVAALVLAGSGAGLLVARHGAAASAATSGLAVWNPYVTERLLLGQPPTLLGYAVMPWVLLAARSRAPLRRRLVLVLLAAAPAVLTPWGGVVAGLTAVLGTLSREDRRPRDVAATGVLAAAWCLPWVVPALVVGGVRADPLGAVAFALADDTGLGTWLSALFGGGVWGTAARPRSREDPLVLVASTSVLLLAGAGAALVRRDVGRRWWVVAVATALLPATLLTLLSGPALEVSTVAQDIPGVALLRDQHRLLAPGVLGVAVLCGLAVGAVGRRAGQASGVVLGVLAMVLAVGSVPDLPRSVRAAYRPMPYPADWQRMTSAVEDLPGDPVVASFPWQSFRRPDWAGGQVFLDPLPRALTAEVRTDTALAVRRDGVLVEVDPGDATDAAWRRGRVTADSLHERGVTHVVEWLGTPGELPDDRRGWVEVIATAHFRVWDVTSAR